MPQPITPAVANVIRRANAALSAGDHETAQAAAREAVERAQAGLHRPTQASAHYTLAATLWADESASVTEAREHAYAAAETAQSHTEEHYRATILLARIEAGLGHFEQAQTLNEDLLATFQCKHRFADAAEILRNLGDTALQRSDLESAQGWFEQGLSLYENGEVDNKYSHAGLLISMGTLAFRQGDLRQAAVYWQKAKALGEELQFAPVIERAEQGLFLLHEIASQVPPQQNEHRSG